MPSGMVLPVEGELAPTIGDRRTCRRALPGTAPVMHDLDGRSIKDMPPQTTHRGAEVDVLAVEKETLVEQPRRLCLWPPNEETGAAHPVDDSLFTGTTLDQLGQ